MRNSRLCILRFLSVVLMLSGWFVASNRCAFATMGGGTPAAKIAAIHKCCPAKSADGTEQSPAKRSGECCQGLRVLPVEANAKLVKAPAIWVLFELAWTAVTVAVEKGDAEGIDAGSHPPEARLFAEVVLQRSLLSHAPPLAV